MIDVRAARIFGPVDHLAFHLGPAPHILGIDQQQGDPRVALEVLEPPAIRAAVDPERPILLLEPDRHHLDRTVLAGGPNERGEDFLGKGLHFWTELNRHQTTSHLNSRVASTTATPSQMKMPSKSVRMAQSEAPSTLILRRASETYVSGEYCGIVCSHSGTVERQKYLP